MTSPKKSPKQTPSVMTVDEAAAFLRISRQSAYDAVHSGDIPHVRLGRTIRVPRAALKRMLGESEGD